LPQEIDLIKFKRTLFRECHQHKRNNRYIWLGLEQITDKESANMKLDVDMLQFKAEIDSLLV